MRQETNEHASPTTTQLGAASDDNKRRPYAKPELTRISLTHTRFGGSTIVDFGDTGGLTIYRSP